MGGEKPCSTVAELSHNLPLQLKVTLVSVLDTFSNLAGSAALAFCSHIRNVCLIVGISFPPHTHTEIGVLLQAEPEDLSSLVPRYRSPQSKGHTQAEEQS